MNRVGVVEQEHTDIAAADALRQPGEIVQRRGGGGGWHAVPRRRGVKGNAAGNADAADKPVKGGGGLEVEQPVAMGAGRPAGDGDAGGLGGEIPG